jgi:Ca2+-binding EF-hand superfamily protein
MSTFASEGDLRSAFRTYDLDGSGCVHARHAYVHAALNKIDATHGSGRVAGARSRIDASELQSLARQLGLHLSGAEVEEALAIVDADGSGKIEQVGRLNDRTGVGGWGS